jgi:predicted TIM-barrel fold metal-dependent hydrolase
MDDLVFFDLNGVLGAPVFDSDCGMCTGYGSIETLLADMDYFGVDYALVSHFRCLYGSPMLGNELLVHEMAARSNPRRLAPCWYLLPGATGEIPAGKELAGSLKGSGVRAVRLDFGAFNLPAGDRSLQDLFSLLEEEEILAILRFPTLGVPVPEREDPFLEMLDGLLGTFRNLKIASGGRLRSIYPLMERHENLRLSMEWDPHPDFVEDVCRRFGGHRLLFASPFSENGRGNPGMPMLTIAYADIPESEKRKIAGANLAALLDPSAAVPEPVRELPGREQFASLRAGRRLDWPVVDIHAHAGSWSWEYKPGSDLDALAAVMDRTGVDQVCLNSTEAVLGGDHMRANAELAEKVRSFPGRFLGFAVVNPHFTDCSGYIEALVHTLGFRGLKIHPRTHRCAIRDPRYNPVWEASANLKIPVLCHTGQGQAFSEPDQFHEVAPRYPKGIFIIGHSGETFAGMLQCIELANRYENVYLETSGWLFMKWGFLEYLLSRVSAERVLFGSDYSWIDIRYALATVLFSRLGDREKRLILSDNSRRILGLGGFE